MEEIKQILRIVENQVSDLQELQCSLESNVISLRSAIERKKTSEDIKAAVSRFGKKINNAIKNSKKLGNVELVELFVGIEADYNCLGQHRFD